MVFAPARRAARASSARCPPVFVAGWLGSNIALVSWFAGRAAVHWLAFPPLAHLLHSGNIEPLLAAEVVVGFRWPTAWAFVLLTNVTPGAAPWFLVRRAGGRRWLSSVSRRGERLGAYLDSNKPVRMVRLGSRRQGTVQEEKSRCERGIGWRWQ